MRRAVRILVGALLVLPAIALALVALGPRVADYRTLTVLSGSMAPAMPAGSVAVVRPEPQSSVRPGQVVTFRSPLDAGRVITHRVTHVSWTGGHAVVRTRGDAGARPDPWRARLGDGPAWHVVAVVPHAGRVVGWLRRPLVRAVTTVVAPVLWVLLMLRAVWRPRVPARGVAAAALVATPLVLPAVAAAAFSARAQATQTVSAGALTAPLAPTLTMGCVLDILRVDVAWAIPTGLAPDGLELERRTSGGAWATIATLTGGTTTSYRDRDVAHNRTYEYRLRTRRAAWRSAYGAVATVTTPLLCL